MSKTVCGHDISVRCARCAADFDSVQPRRWAVMCSRSKTLAGRGVSPAEARAALMGILSQLGQRLDLVREYDPQHDRFALLVRDAHGVQRDSWVECATVADVVTTMRTLAGMPRGMKRPSEKRSKVG